MKAKNNKLIERCVEDGIKWGLQRAHKHTDKPSMDRIAAHIHEAVIAEIYEWFSFGEPFDAP